MPMACGCLQWQSKSCPVLAKHCRQRELPAAVAPGLATAAAGVGLPVTMWQVLALPGMRVTDWSQARKDMMSWQQQRMGQYSQGQPEVPRGLQIRRWLLKPHPPPPAHAPLAALLLLLGGAAKPAWQAA